MAWRMRARHRLHEPEATVDRASDEEIVALLRACRSARDRLIVLLMARAGLRRGELCGLRRSDVHLLADSRLLGCEMPRAHLHVVRRENPNGAWAKSRRQRVVPLDFLVVQVFDVYEFERFAVPRAAESDFLLVNLFREPIGAPMRPDAINELIAACSRRAGIEHVTPHRLRHAFGSNLADAGAGLDEIATLMGHASMSSSQVYLHPDPARLREAVDRVPVPASLPGRTGERRRGGAGGRVVAGGVHVFADPRDRPARCGDRRGDRPRVPRRGRVGSGAKGAVVRPGASVAGTSCLPRGGLFDIRAGGGADLRLVPPSARRTRAR